MYGERENNLTLLMYRERKKTEQMGFVFFTSNCLKRQKKKTCMIFDSMTRSRYQTKQKWGVGKNK